jgi:DNA-directed RNA polymerase
MSKHDQYALEREMAEKGQQRYQRKRQVAEEKGIETTTPAGQWLLANAIVPLTAALTEWKQEALAKPGKMHRAVAYYDMLDTELAAAIICRCIIDAISRAKKMSRCCLMVAGLLEDEVRFQQLASTDRGLWRELFERTREYGGYMTKRRHIVHACGKVNHGFQNWPQVDKMSVGIVAVTLMEKATRLIEVQTRKDMFNKSHTEVRATEQAMYWLKECHARSELLSPVYLPCIDQPKDWTSPLSGGFHSAQLHKRAMIKTNDHQYIKEVSSLEMPMVYEAINALQQTAFTPNAEIAKIMQYFWENDLSAGGLPLKENAEIPPRPDDIDTNEEARKAWRRSAAAVHDNNSQTRAERLALAKVLHLTDKYADQKMYYAHQCDWRGRVYPTAYHLHPQGPDHVKSLLLFFKGDPLSTTDSRRWFKVHGANCWGLSKSSFEERVAWVDKNLPTILSYAEMPYTSRGWEDAGEPWSFLAWCLEMRKWKEEGHNYVCRLPIPQDATQSGVQIMSLLLRDEIGARATNCVSSERPQDLYGQVAETVVSLLKQRPDDELAQMWLKMNIDRKATKRIVMTRPYSSTLYSGLRYVREWAADKGGLPLEHDFSACYYLAKTIWEAMDKVMRGTQRCMEWLAKVSDLCVANGVPVRWTTPVGFLVQQSYSKTELKCVKTMIGDTFRKHGYREDLEEVDPRKMRNGISPNYVHSLDAAALMKTVLIAQQQGVRDFAMVHDSFATTAFWSEDLAQSIREAYHQIFKSDRLADFKREVEANLPEGTELPPLPEYGTLDPDVRGSSYFFN